MYMLPHTYMKKKQRIECKFFEISHSFFLKFESHNTATLHFPFPKIYLKICVCMFSLNAYLYSSCRFSTIVSQNRAANTLELVVGFYVAAGNRTHVL